MRELGAGFGTAEWGFAIGSAFWGTGVFQDGAELVLDFAFETIGVHRLEARAAVKNGRGNGALQKLGAVQEGMLRKSFLKNGEYLDQVLYAILDDDWRGCARGRAFRLRALRAQHGALVSSPGPATRDVCRPFLLSEPPPAAASYERDSLSVSNR